MTPKYYTEISEIPFLSDKEKKDLRRVTKRYSFFANDYYLNLINWQNPHDPIRRIIIPHPSELLNIGDLDPSNEKKYTVCQGVEHKYTPTALLLSTNNCSGLCRFCFRKRLFFENNNEIAFDFQKTLHYFAEHKELNNVLITGGDPLTLPFSTLNRLLESIYKLEHIRFIRIGTKLPAYNPHKILNSDSTISELVRSFSNKKRKLYIITHFNHSRELTDAAIEGIHILQQAGAEIANQTPMLRGVNNSPAALAELLNKLAAAGIAPYYVFQCRPTIGNSSFSVPIEEGYTIFEKTKAKLSGLAKRARFILSHETGKLEVAALTQKRIFFKYHNAAKDNLCGKTIFYKRNPKAKWLNDYIDSTGEIPQKNVYIS